MKVFELLSEARIRPDPEQLRVDYQLWKRLVNMPNSAIEKLLDTSAGQKSGLSKRETLHVTKYSKNSLRSTLKMRSKPLSSWTAADINWMHRQLANVKRLKNGDGSYFNDNKKPSKKLKSLWLWGNVPGGHKP